MQFPSEEEGQETATTEHTATPCCACGHSLDEALIAVGPVTVFP